MSFLYSVRDFFADLVKLSLSFCLEFKHKYNILKIDSLYIAHYANIFSILGQSLELAMLKTETLEQQLPISSSPQTPQLL